jgi:hypothetical protein
MADAFVLAAVAFGHQFGSGQGVALVLANPHAA